MMRPARLPHADQDPHPRRRHPLGQAAGRAHRSRRRRAASTTTIARSVRGARRARRVDGCDALLVSDYGSGLVTPALVARTRRRRCGAAAAPGRPVRRSSSTRATPCCGYRGMTACTPNESEVEQALGIRIGDNARALERAGRDAAAPHACGGGADHARQPRHGAVRAGRADRAHPDLRLRSDRRRHRRRRHRHRDDDAGACGGRVASRRRRAWPTTPAASS